MGYLLEYCAQLEALPSCQYGMAGRILNYSISKTKEESIEEKFSQTNAGNFEQNKIYELALNILILEMTPKNTT